MMCNFDRCVSLITTKQPKQHHPDASTGGDHDEGLRATPLQAFPEDALMPNSTVALLFSLLLINCTIGRMHATVTECTA